MLPPRAPEWCSHTHHLRQRGWSLPGTAFKRQNRMQSLRKRRPPLLPCLPAAHTVPQQHQRIDSGHQHCRLLHWSAVAKVLLSPRSLPSTPSQLHPLPQSRLLRVQQALTGCPVEKAKMPTSDSGVFRTQTFISAAMSAISSVSLSTYQLPSVVTSTLPCRQSTAISHSTIPATRKRPC